tara:strand:- start:2125 stop:3279 length:1155 start_codon:yes stop_codon:yes gene_type:complete
MQVIKYLNSKAIILGHEGALEALTEELGIKVTYNEEYDLYVLNYSQIDSPKTHPIVAECRSLVLGVDETGNGFYIVSRSFDRFLNLGENGNEGKIDITKMRAYEKLDGSLIGLFFHKGDWLYRTKAMIMPAEDMHVDAFGNSWKELIESALGNDYLPEIGDRMRGFFSNKTLILELTSPYNRIVTRYEDTNLTLLAIRCHDKGEYIMSHQILSKTAMNCGWRVASYFEFSTLAKCREVVESLPNLEEGFVLYDESGVPQCKVKSPIYLAVHRIRGESIPTPKRIMDLVFTNETDEYLTYFEEDRYLFQPYIQAFLAAELFFNLTWCDVSSIENQKEFAMSLQGNPVMHLMFRKKQNNDLTFRDCFGKLSSSAKYNLTEKYLNEH